MAIQKEENTVLENEKSSSDSALAKEIQKNEDAQLEKEEFRKLQVC